MAVKVTSGEAKKDEMGEQILGSVMQMGKSYLSSFLSEKEQPKPEELPGEDAETSPRKRRMASYTA